MLKKKAYFTSTSILIWFYKAIRKESQYHYWISAIIAGLGRKFFGLESLIVAVGMTHDTKNYFTGKWNLGNTTLVLLN